jgi:predicted glycoside hydrolase/deacetylase ChbG (UPF0249 family)
MRRLIINADDLGSGIQRDRGIFHSFSCGIVTSASLLANGPSFASAARQALDLGLPLGIHLNLSEGRPLTGTIPSLTTETGEFPGKEGLRRILSGGRIDPRPLYRELSAQIERVIAAGLAPDHLDGHQHCLLFPALCAVVLDLARKYSIGAMRLPSPAEPPADDPDGPLGKELALYRSLVPHFSARVREAGMVTPDGLFGMPLLNGLNTRTLCQTLQRIPEGTWELMVHPGYPDAAPFSGAERKEELAALSSPTVAEELRRCGITPITFRDLSCES